MNPKFYLRYIYIFFSLFLSGIILNGCSGAKEAVSDWNNSQVNIDGNATEWGKSLQYLKDDNVAVGFKNDNKFLYVCLTTSDRARIMPILGGGLIVWFKPEDGGKTFGVKYPMPADRADFQKPGQGAFEQGNAGFDRENRSEMMNRMLDRQNDLQIVDEDNHPLNLYPIENTHGIKAKLGYHSDQFVYELAVPISGNNKYPYEVAMGKDNKVKIEFETQEMQRRNSSRERNGDESQGDNGGSEGGEGGMGPGGEGGGMEGGMGYGGYGRQRTREMGGRQSSFEPLDLSFEVTLKTAE
jgi:hypothetical protein